MIDRLANKYIFKYVSAMRNNNFESPTINAKVRHEHEGKIKLSSQPEIDLELNPCLLLADGN